MKTINRFMQFSFFIIMAIYALIAPKTTMCIFEAYNQKSNGICKKEHKAS